MIRVLAETLSRAADEAMAAVDRVVNDTCTAWDNWRSRRADKRAQADYRRGWDWAAGELLMGTPARVIEMQTDVDFRSAFDYGADAAVQQWYALEQVKRDSLFRVPDCCGSTHIH